MAIELKKKKKLKIKMLTVSSLEISQVVNLLIENNIMEMTSWLLA